MIHHHVPQFRGNGAAGAGNDHKGGEERTEFPGDHQDQDAIEELVLEKLGQQGGALDDDYRPKTQGEKRDHRQGFHAGKIDLHDQHAETDATGTGQS